MNQHQRVEGNSGSLEGPCSERPGLFLPEATNQNDYRSHEMNRILPYTNDDNINWGLLAFPQCSINSLKSLYNIDDPISLTTLDTVAPSDLCCSNFSFDSFDVWRPEEHDQGLPGSSFGENSVLSFLRKTDITPLVEPNIFSEHSSYQRGGHLEKIINSPDTNHMYQNYKSKPFQGKNPKMTNTDQHFPEYYLDRQTPTKSSSDINGFPKKSILSLSLAEKNELCKKVRQGGDLSRHNNASSLLRDKGAPSTPVHSETTITSLNNDKIPHTQNLFNSSSCINVPEYSYVCMPAHIKNVELLVSDKIKSDLQMFCNRNIRNVPTESSDIFNNLPCFDLNGNQTPFSKEEFKLVVPGLPHHGISLLKLEPPRTWSNSNQLLVEGNKRPIINSFCMRNLSSDVYRGFHDLSDSVFSCIPEPLHYHSSPKLVVPYNAEFSPIIKSFKTLNIGSSTAVSNDFNGSEINKTELVPYKSRNKKNQNDIGCKFCKSNCESKEVYNSHVLKKKVGKKTLISCPILRSLVCERCGGTGDTAHTRSYCPLLIAENGSKPKSIAIEIKKTKRVASGKIRRINNF